MKDLIKVRGYRQRGFTIVELLIVIVVIAILAAISIVAYNGIQERARASEVSSALSQAKKKIGLWQVDNPDSAPSDLATAGVSNTGNVSYQYRIINTTTGAYCITATSGPTSYNVTNATSPSSGACAGHGAGGKVVVTNLVLNPNTEGSSGWSVGGVVSGDYLSGFDGATKAYRMTRTGSGAAVLRGDASLMANTSYTALLTLRSNIGTTVTLQFRGSASSGHASTIGTATLTADQPQTVRVTGTSWSGTQESANIAVSWSSGTTNHWVEVTRAMIVEGNYSGGYADGNSAGWIWNGTQNAATSTGQAP